MAESCDFIKERLNPVPGHEWGVPDGGPSSPSENYVMPDVIIVFLEIGDAAGCQLMSMLKMDDHTSAIPILTCAVPGDERHCRDDAGNVERDGSPVSLAVPMN